MTNTTTLNPEEYRIIAEARPTVRPRATRMGLYAVRPPPHPSAAMPAMRAPALPREARPTVRPGAYTRPTLRMGAVR